MSRQKFNLEKLPDLQWHDNDCIICDCCIPPAYYISTKSHLKKDKYICERCAIEIHMAIRHRLDSEETNECKAV